LGAIRYEPAITLYYTMNDGQAHAGSFPCFFRGEIRIKDPLPYLRSYSFPTILNRQLDEIARLNMGNINEIRLGEDLLF